MVRRAIVAGQFYPEDVERLNRMIEKFSPKATSKINAKAIILPHAGYIYSGKVAAVTVSKISPKKRLIILGPNHTGLGEDFALWTKGEWCIPSGKIPIDENLAESILKKGNYIKEDYFAHQNEHSIEVELPILNYFFGEFKFVPICCQISNIEEYKMVASQIIEGIKQIKEEILLVASTDMSHYEPDSTARKKDRLALEAITNLDAEALVRVTERERVSMCGVSPVAILLFCVKGLRAKKAHVELYQTSGDVSGDYSSVVGYAGVVIT
jgi:hypothetical protein